VFALVSLHEALLKKGKNRKYAKFGVLLVLFLFVVFVFVLEAK